MTPDAQTIALLEAKLAETQGHFDTAVILLDHSTDAVDRRDETIAAQVAQIDQLKAQVARLEREAEGYLAANEQMHADKAYVIRQMTAMQRGES